MFNIILQNNIDGYLYIGDVPAFYLLQLKFAQVVADRRLAWIGKERGVKATPVMKLIKYDFLLLMLCRRKWNRCRIVFIIYSYRQDGGERDAVLHQLLHISGGNK